VDILGVGPLELIIILVVALAVFGPDRLPEMGAKLGRAMRQMRRATRDFSREIEKAREAIDPDQQLSQPFQEIGSLVKDATTAAEAVRQPGKALRRAFTEEVDAALHGGPAAAADATAAPDAPEAASSSAQTPTDAAADGGASEIYADAEI
jgi:TatA/E family protein of Tat protein translocase